MYFEGNFFLAFSWEIIMRYYILYLFLDASVKLLWMQPSKKQGIQIYMDLCFVFVCLHKFFMTGKNWTSISQLHVHDWRHHHGPPFHRVSILFTSHFCPLPSVVLWAVILSYAHSRFHHVLFPHLWDTGFSYCNSSES